jgi:hypothetical protein
MTETKIRVEQKQRASAAPKPPKQDKRPPVPRGRGAGGLVGIEPRVDLLPTEVHVERKQRATARRAWFGVVLVGVVVAIAVAASTLQAARAQSDLESVQGETSTLLVQQGKYTELRDVERRSALIEAGQAVGGAAEINWKAYITELQAKLPAGVTITQLTIDSQSPIATYAQSSTPFEGQRIATVTATVTSPTIPSVPDWTDSIAGVTGYVDSTISSITRQSSSNNYSAEITIHANEKAFDHKYSKGK